MASKKKKILSVDIGGGTCKFLLSGKLKALRVETGKSFAPKDLLKAIEELPEDWHYDCVSIGFPGRVNRENRIFEEPLNLGKGWVKFDFEKALDKPVKVVNDAVLQAIGSYRGGRMLYLGFGTGVGSALIIDHMVINLELGALHYGNTDLAGDVLSKEKLRKVGKKEWNRRAKRLAVALREAFLADYLIMGGGNSRHLKHLPKKVERGDNKLAFVGGYLLWEMKKNEPLFTILASNPHSFQPGRMKTDDSLL